MSGRGCILFIIRVIIETTAIIETTGEREGGEGGKERGSPGYGGERGEGMRYHIVGVFAYFAIEH